MFIGFQGLPIAAGADREHRNYDMLFPPELSSGPASCASQ
jgi:hypothetical protein